MMHSVFSDLKENDSEEFKQLMILTARRTACNCPFCAQGGIRDEVGTKLHRCLYENCERTFRKTSHLKVHLRSHSGEKPFKCDWVQVPGGKSCDREFTRSDELKRHMRTHTDDKQFHCTFCEKRFMRSDHLHKHLKTHTKESKMKTCPYCPKKFLRIDNLEMHVLGCREQEKLETKPQQIAPERSPQQLQKKKSPSQKAVPLAQKVKKEPASPPRLETKIDTNVSEIDIKKHFMLSHSLVPVTNVNLTNTSDLLLQCTSSSNSDESEEDAEGSLHIEEKLENPQVEFNPSTTEDGYLEEPE